MRLLLAISTLLCLLSSSVSFAEDVATPRKLDAAGKRVALVIGNGSYVPDALDNPTNDARDMSAALARLGFEVIHRDNLNRQEMMRTVREFGAKLHQGDVGLFYYAGHGIAVQGINYLVPIGANINSEQEVEFEALDTGFVLAQLEAAGNALNIVILDACRNNPYGRSFRSMSRGLVEMKAPTGTLVAYATAPGKVASDGEIDGKNGLYTQELLKFLQAPGLGVEDVFKRVRMSVHSRSNGNQVPWESSSLVSDFYFVKSKMPQVDVSCLREPGFRTTATGDKSSFVIKNASAVPVTLSWINYEGQRIRYVEIPTDHEYNQEVTYLGHQWVASDASGKCLLMFEAPGTFVIK